MDGEDISTSCNGTYLVVFKINFNPNTNIF